MTKSFTRPKELASFFEKQNSDFKKSSEDLIAQIICKEMSLFKAKKIRSENLQKLFGALLSLKPTSVEAERAFSYMGYFATKRRNILHNESTNALIFMRNYFVKFDREIERY